MKAILIYNKFYDPNENKPTIGGIQTYICDLAKVLVNNSYDIEILQPGQTEEVYEWNGYLIRSLSITNTKYEAQIKKYIKNNVEKDDLVIFMTHTINCKISHKKTISIQHGIYWDIPYTQPRASSVIEFIFRNLHAWKDLKKVNLCKNCVAVDYNFLNWYKTQQYFIRSDIKVIPNYCTVSENYKPRENKENIKILFARRFEEYRGTRIFAKAVDELLEKYDNVEFTFAGGGPDERLLNEHFKDSTRVKFIKYGYGESQQIHEQHDIAVVASIGSEGTSLSLLEAMGAGCAVVCTNVGGLTNIVLNRFNGRICDITSSSLSKALSDLIEDKEQRELIARRGYDTAKTAFNKSDWEKKWDSIIKKITSQEG